MNGHIFGLAMLIPLGGVLLQKMPAASVACLPFFIGKISLKLRCRFGLAMLIPLGGVLQQKMPLSLAAFFVAVREGTARLLSYSIYTKLRSVHKEMETNDLSPFVPFAV